MVQVMHLTTAVFLIVLGSFLEYTSSADLIILLISAFTAFMKIIFGFYYKTHSEDLRELKIAELNKDIPFELIFAICDSIKYVQIIYITKWVHRNYITSIVGFWFILLSLSGYTSILKMQTDKETYENAVTLILIISGFILLIGAFLQYKILSMDPLDSDYIINE